ncbi:MAG: rod shape-determining protein MreD [Crocinitomicaceae bacterium]|nr:rod shape-determining protein MreD [Crocinitomicaceae bacterium]
MKLIAINSARFILFVTLQVLIFNQLEIGLGIHPMVYPLFIMLLPFSISTISLLVIAFFMGLFIDIFSNTGGLHASSLLLFAFFRPIIFKAFSPRDGYDMNKEPSIYEMGRQWFIYCFGILLIIHHTWFFFMEVFKFSEFLYVLKKLILTLPISYLLVILLQFLFIKGKVSK